MSEREAWEVERERDYPTPASMTDPISTMLRDCYKLAYTAALAASAASGVGAELAKLRQLVSALEWLPEMTIAFSDLDMFLDEVREMGWRPDPEPAPEVAGAATSVGEWIPVGERLPADGQHVWVVEDGMVFWDVWERIGSGDVTHWQLPIVPAPPLPDTGEL